MAHSRKTRKGCDRCIALAANAGLSVAEAEKVPARFRILVNRYLCEPCYDQTVKDAYPEREDPAA